MIGVIINDTQTITFEEAAEVASKSHQREIEEKLGQYRTILSADAASEKYKLLSKKRR